MLTFVLCASSGVYGPIPFSIRMLIFYCHLFKQRVIEGVVGISALTKQQYINFKTLLDEVSFESCNLINAW